MQELWITRLLLHACLSVININVLICYKLVTGGGGGGGDLSPACSKTIAYKNGSSVYRAIRVRSTPYDSIQLLVKTDRQADWSLSTYYVLTIPLKLCRTCECGR